MATVAKAADRHTAVTTGWTNPANAYALTGDDVYATAAPGAKNTTVNGDFGFPAFTTADIPDGSTINSVTAEVEWKVSTTASVATLGLQLYNGATALGTETTDTAEPTVDTIATHQVTTGVALADLRTAGTVAARARTTRGNSTTAVTGSLDYAKLTVDYTAAATPTLHSETGTLSFSGSRAVKAATARTGALDFAAALSSAYTSGAVPALVATVVYAEV